MHGGALGSATQVARSVAAKLARPLADRRPGRNVGRSRGAPVQRNPSSRSPRSPPASLYVSGEISEQTVHRTRAVGYGPAAGHHATGVTACMRWASTCARASAWSAVRRLDKPGVSSGRDVVSTDTAVDEPHDRTSHTDAPARPSKAEFFLAPTSDQPLGEGATRPRTSWSGRVGPGCSVVAACRAAPCRRALPDAHLRV